MTTQQVASRYYELAQQKKWAQIREELYSQNIVNREPEHAIAKGIPTLTVGMEAVMAKSKTRQQLIEALHDDYCSEPVIGGGFFSVSMWRDITFKGQPRIKAEEIAVFKVEDGKIVLEQFFY